VELARHVLVRERRTRTIHDHLAVDQLRERGQLVEQRDELVGAQRRDESTACAMPCE
jgi:hypothetical protein